MSTVPVEDRLAIQETCARYASLCDTGHMDKMYEVFTEDGLFDESIIGVPVVRGAEAMRTNVFGQKGVDAICKRFGQSTFTLTFVIHLTSNHVIHEFNGTTASGATHLHCEIGFADGKTLRILGYYADQYVKQNGRWLISSRILHALAPLLVY